MTLFLMTSTTEGARFLLPLLIVLVAAKVMAELFERLRQPAVAGEILAGVLIGPSVLNWVAPSDFISLLAEIGVILLLFSVGLEIKPAAIFRVGKRATLVAILGVIAPFGAGWLLMHLWGASGVEAMFVGTAMVATSVGITARVLSSSGLLEVKTAQIILGAAVIDDILGLLVLAVVTSLASGSINYTALILTSALAIGFTTLVALVGAPAVTRLAPRIENLRVSHALFVASLLLCLGLSAAASYIGVAAIIGAFLAGLAFAEASEDKPTMRQQMSGVTEFLVPFFLVNIGMQLRLEVFRDRWVVALAILVTLIAVLTKLVACGLGAQGLGWRRAGQIGMGMVPRGEVGIVVAQIGLALAVIDQSLYGVVLVMAVATTLIAPPFLRLLYASEVRQMRTNSVNDDLQ